MSRPDPLGAPARSARVGYVLKMYPRFSETFVVNEMLALQERGVELEVFSLRTPTDGRFHASLAELRAPVTYSSHPLRARDLWDVLRDSASELPHLGRYVHELVAVAAPDAAAAVELAVAVRRRGLTHLHAHFASSATTVARLAALLSGVGYSFTAHAKDLFHEDVDPDDLRRKLSGASTAVTVSDFNLAWLRRGYGEDAARVRRVYNGLDLDQFGYTAPVGRPAVVVAVGRLVEKKGFCDLVSAVALLAAQGRHVRLEIVGTGELEGDLRRQVDDLGLEDRVVFHGPLPQTRVREVVRSAAVFAAPCVVGADGNRDGLPTVLLEAMALGTPCVATPVTGVPEVVRHGRTGLLVEEHDPPGLARAIAQVLDDPATAEAMARQARTLVERDFDVRRAAAQLEQVFAAGVAATPVDAVPTLTAVTS